MSNDEVAYVCKQLANIERSLLRTSKDRNGLNELLTQHRRWLLDNGYDPTRFNNDCQNAKQVFAGGRTKKRVPTRRRRSRSQSPHAAQRQRSRSRSPVKSSEKETKQVLLLPPPPTKQDPMCSKSYFCTYGIRCKHVHTPLEIYSFFSNQGRGERPFKTDMCKTSNCSDVTCHYAHHIAEVRCLLCHFTGHTLKTCPCFPIAAQGTACAPCSMTGFWVPAPLASLGVVEIS
jgi:hypothetical protein